MPLIEHNKTRLLIARHGETYWNKEKRLQGHLNSELTPHGNLQAEALSMSLLSESIDFIVSSPLKRAYATAQQCSRHLNVELLINEQIKERNFGEWQSLLFESLKEERFFSEIFFQVTEHLPPGGESGKACAQRMHSALLTLAQNNYQKTILVITHGDAIRCFLDLLSEDSACDAYSQYGNGRVFTIDYCFQNKHFIYEKISNKD